MKRRSIPKLKKGAWFVPVRGSYLPMAWQAWLLYIPYTVYIVASLVFVTEHAHSVLEIVLNIVPYWVAALVLMTWIAKQKS